MKPDLELLSDEPDAAAIANRLAAAPLASLLEATSHLRDRGHGEVISYSRKVFIPLTRLCRDVCHYCTFARPPRRGERAYLSPEEVLAIARAGEAAGCHEALFTLGDKPELRYRAARDELGRLGHDGTISYLAEMCARVLAETSLLPHVNPGVMTADEIAVLRQVSVSQGLMLESVAERLCEPGGPHHGSPDKAPAARLETIRLAGEQRVPFTTGILIGIGETRSERVRSMLAIRELGCCLGHIQEVIVQNFRAKPGTRMAEAPEPSLEELLWTIAAARLILGPEMSIQAPPNLSPGVYPRLIAAGLNDWGGVSPVTPDHVNPEAPWPALDALGRATEESGKSLVARLPVHPRYALASARWQDAALASRVVRAIDSEGFARTDGWAPGLDTRPPAHLAAGRHRPSDEIAGLIAKASDGTGLDEAAIVRLFQARGRDFEALRAATDALRRRAVGDAITYVVNRNINYTNVCYFRCGFCAFSKGRLSENLRGRSYLLDAEEVARRVREAWARGATEVCMQGGLHPAYTGETYLAFCRVVKEAAPDIHLHAFSPLEVTQGAATLGLSVHAFLRELQAAGLGSLPGTAAEILDDGVRATLCPDKIDTAQWLRVMETAHELGLRSTATIMFGHVDTLESWARHLMRLRALQGRTGGFTEFVPLPFVHMEAPIYRKGMARKGPTFREAMLMHAVARLALHPVIVNIQTSWVKMGFDGAKACLEAGANDLGGTLMNESISRAAGATHGQEMSPASMEAVIRSLGRTARQRTTLYRPVPETRRRAAFKADALSPLISTPARDYAIAASEGLNARTAPGAAR